jgi:hypothetical protein
VYIKSFNPLCKKVRASFPALFFYFPLGGLFPLPPPDGFPVVLGAFTGFPIALIFKINN